MNARFYRRPSVMLLLSVTALIGCRSLPVVEPHDRIRIVMTMDSDTMVGRVSSVDPERLTLLDESVGSVLVRREVIGTIAIDSMLDRGWRRNLICVFAIGGTASTIHYVAREGLQWPLVGVVPLYVSLGDDCLFPDDPWRPARLP